MTDREGGGQSGGAEGRGDGVCALPQAASAQLRGTHARSRARRSTPQRAILTDPGDTAVSDTELSDATDAAISKFTTQSKNHP